ncbi:hypothetical protein MD484_g3261, partial [Candolleomyces efflorescens]
MPLPAPSLFLQHLTRLRLYTTEETLSIFRLLDILILPALCILHISGEFDSESARPLFRKILLLIQQSGCSIEKLTILAPLDTQQEEFYEILSLSPGLQCLEVPHIDTQGLRKLTLHTSDAPSQQLIPHLRVLKLCWYGLPPDGQHPGTVFFAALKELVGNRASLGQVHLSRYQSWDLHVQVETESLWNPTATDVNSEDALVLASQAEDFEQTLAEFLQYSFILWYTPQQHALACTDTVLQEELDRAMCKLESMNLAHRANSLALVRKNILQLLHELNQLEAGVIPGDDRFAFRVRAGEVCQKWKPFILRDARATQYAWRYVDHSLSILTCRPVDEDEEKTWKDIISRCNP